jgi:hypothetical protein
MSALPAATADRAALARLLTESGVERHADSPSWTAYLVSLVEAALRWFSARMKSLPVSLDPTWAGVLAWLLAALALSMLVVYGLRRANRRRRRGPALQSLGDDRSERRTTLNQDREAWRLELEAALSSGNAARALAALWWWLARSLCGPQAEASWTSRELLLRAGREDLRPLTKELDRLTYGESAPASAEVRGLWRRLEQSVP